MLGLKGEEKRKVDLLEKEHHKEKRKLVHKDMDLHDQLFSSFGDKDKSDSLLMVIDKNKSKIEEMTFEYFNEIASYCDKGQSEILHSFLKDSFEKMRGPAPFGR